MSDWERKWNEDIDFLKDTLIKNHKNLFHYTKKEVFIEKVDKLKDMINELDYNEMKVEISKLTACIRDAHTTVVFPVKKYLPFKFFWFSNGIYIVKGNKEYEKNIFSKLIKIEDLEIEKVLDDLRSMISYENESLFKAQSVKYLQAVDVLYGLLIIDDMEKIKLTISNKGLEEEICVNSVLANEINYIEGYIPFHLKNENKNIWFEIDKDLIYIKYNSCRECNEYLIEDKITEIIENIEVNNIKKVTIDLRNNMGGDSTLIRTLIDYLKNNKEINKKDNLKVIIGRETFSSALLNAYEFKNETNAIIIGEPSGGKPNCYGEIKKFVLPNSKFIVSYSTKFYKLIEDDTVMSLYPDNYKEMDVT